VLVGFSTQLDSFGQRIFREGITAALLNQLEFGYDQWMIRYGEGQPRDDRVRERFAGNIDTAPETVGVEKDAVRSRCRSIKKFLPTDLNSLLFHLL